MTIQELFDKMRLLPDWSAEIKINTHSGVFEIRDVSVGEKSGALYLTVGEREKCGAWEAIDEI